MDDYPTPNFMPDTPLTGPQLVKPGGRDPMTTPRPRDPMPSPGMPDMPMPTMPMPGPLHPGPVPPPKPPR